MRETDKPEARPVAVSPSDPSDPAYSADFDRMLDTRVEGDCCTCRTRLNLYMTLFGMMVVVLGMMLLELSFLAYMYSVYGDALLIGSMVPPLISIGASIILVIIFSSTWERENRAVRLFREESALPEARLPPV